MRILYITPLYLPWVGGLEIICSQLLGEFRQRGHDVAVLTAVNDPITPRGLVAVDEIPVLRTNIYRAVATQSPSEMLRVRQQVSAFVEDFSPDLVHAHDPCPLLWIYQRLARQRRPLILTMHVVMSRHDPALFKASLKLMDEVDWVTGVSDDVVRDTISYSPSLRDRISMVGNGVVPPGPPPGPVSDGPAELLCVGRLVPQKGFDVALDALALLVAQRPTIHLSIAGEGPRFKDLATQIERLGLGDHATLLGRVEHDQIGPLMAAATVVVMPSRWEGLPLVALEAAYMERPVVGSDAPGLGSAIEDGVTGLVVPQDDPDKLAAALLRLIDDRDEARALGARARAAAQRNWTIGACADSYERLYERLADRRVA